MKAITKLSTSLSLLSTIAPNLVSRHATCVSAAPAMTGLDVKHESSIHARWSDWDDGHGSSDPVEVDVVVVGGGFSGIAAAYDLHKAGLKTVVLEARDRLGGRSRSQKLESGPGVIELGATWINNVTQPAVFALTEEFGLETIEQYTDGAEIFQDVDGLVYNLSEDSSAEMSEEEQAAALAIVELETEIMTVMGAAVEAIDIRKFDEFPEEDDVDLQEWMSRRDLWDHPFAKGLISQLTGVIVGREPHEIGAHYFFDYVKSGIDFDSLRTEGREGAQSIFIKSGSTSIVTSMAETFPEDSIHLNSPVTHVEEQDDGRLLIKTSSDIEILSKRVILAIPPSLYHPAIEFYPPLPEAKSLADASLPGNYAKLVFTYSSPWWREAGLVGKFPSHAGPFRFSWELVNPEDEQYSLTLFIAGANATAWFALESEEEKLNAVKEQLATIVGEELAVQAEAELLEINYMEWTNTKFIGAGPTVALGPGDLRKYGEVLREVVGGVHFASTEASYEWKGYLEGAVLSGKRAAEEVVKALGE